MKTTNKIPGTPIGVASKETRTAMKIFRSAMKRENKIAAAAADRASEQASAALAAAEAGLADAIAITQAAATAAELPTLPVIPPGATHFRLTRKMLEIASDIRHLAADLKALGQREGDILEFGTMSVSGNFTSNARALARNPNAPAKVRGTGKMLLIDSLIIEGTHTAKSVAAQVVAKFGGDEVKTLVIVRSRPWHLKKAGKLAADRVPFAKAVSVKKTAKVTRAAARALMEYGVRTGRLCS